MAPSKKSIAPSDKTKTPAATPPAGAVTSGTEVTLTSGTDGAEIYYTLDGSTPTKSSTLYESEIEITAPVTIKAIAYADDLAESDILEAAYTLKVATPVATPPAGEVASGSTVALASETVGAAIYYTTDGSNPTKSSTLYESEIEITAPVTIKAKAYADGYTASDALTAEYTVSG